MLEMLEIKLARNMEEFLIKKILEAKRRLWIVSPWLSPEYVNILIEKALDGVEVKIFTTNDTIRSHVEALSKLIYAERLLERSGSRKLRYLSITMTVCGVILALLNYVFSALLVAIGISLYLASRDKYRLVYKCRLGEDSLFVYRSKPTGMLHAKVYIVDEAVALGSVNLTKTSVLNNVEALVWISDKSIVDSVIREIIDLERKSKLERASINEIARLVSKSSVR